MTCDRIRETLPWYVSGSLALDNAEAIAAHLSTCDACRAEFVEIAQLRLRFDQSVRCGAPPLAEAWRSIGAKLGFRDAVRIDLGSALLGLTLGFGARHRREPVRGSLRVCGHRVRFAGKARKKEEHHV